MADNKQTSVNNETITTPDSAVAGDTAGIAKPQEGDSQARAKEANKPKDTPKPQQRMMPATKAASNSGPIGGRYELNGVIVNARGEQID